MPRPHRLRRRLIIGLAVVVVLAIAGPFIFIHLIEGTAAPKLALPGTSKKPVGTTSATSSNIDGIWVVGAGSVAGYRVQEVLLGQHTTAVGRTSKISGSLTIKSGAVTAARFVVVMASVESDQSQRNAQFDGHIMDVAAYPDATLVLTGPIEFGSTPASGQVVHVSASGELTMHGVTHKLSVKLSAERVGDQIDVLADSTILFADWNIQNPSIGGFVTTANSGTLEVLLHLTRGSTSSSVTTTTLGTTGGSPAPVTVPATTLAPLSVPSST
jgi:polyisoprenoid-binding protein YceI